MTLSMNTSMTALDSARIIELHKLLADWGEGTSQATGEEGQGAPATPNDATWRHRFFDTIFWTNEGGDRRGQCKPVGRPCWTVHVEFGADGCRCAIMAGESGQQLRLARVRRRINYYNIKAVRHSGDCQPACADYSIHSRCESSANAAASSHPQRRVHKPWYQVSCHIAAILASGGGILRSKPGRSDKMCELHQTARLEARPTLSFPKVR